MHKTVRHFRLLVHCHEFASLFIGKSAADQRENFLLAHAGVLQFNERRPRNRGLTSCATSRDRHHHLIRISGELDSLRIYSPRAKLAEAREFQRIRIRNSNAQQARYVFPFCKFLLVAPSYLDELNAAVVGEPSLVHLQDLADFRIAHTETAKLLNRV